MLLKKFVTINKTNIFLSIISALLFSYFFTQTFIKQKNLSYFNYDILINNSLDKRYDIIKKHILNKIYGDLFLIIKNNQRFTLYSRYPNVDHWKNKSFLLSQQKIEIDEFINQYKKTLMNNVYFECKVHRINKKACFYERNLWLTFNKNENYITFFNKNIEQKKRNNISVEFFFLKCFVIFLIFFFICFHFFKKENQENKI